MANMELITSVTVGSGGVASVTLPATGTIPATYTDLKILISARSDEAAGTAQSTVFVMSINGVTTDRVFKNLIGYQGTSVASQSLTGGTIGTIPGALVTASTFNNFEVYIPNYTSSNYKSFSVDGVTENNNASNNELRLTAGLWSQTAAITTLGFTLTGGNIVEGSTFYLYGISNVTSTAKATGGIVSSDETYWYHMFPFSSTFTPTEAITADILVVAGGGGGGGSAGGGGGAGGILGYASQSLTATSYTVSIGAGGTGGNNANGVAGGTSQFGALTAAAGGGYGGGGITNTAANRAGGAGAAGGGGGGSGNDGSGTASGGTGTSPGYAGGTSGASPSGGNRCGGGGGGFGTAGSNVIASNTGGNGGNGVNTVTNWGALSAVLTAVQLSPSGYLAGGGGGGSRESSWGGGFNGSGGLGGGGLGDGSLRDGSAGTANTGSGGGGGHYGVTTGQSVGYNGGSGVVIIRYAV